MIFRLIEALKSEYRSISRWYVPAFVAGILSALHLSRMPWEFCGIILFILAGLSYFKSVFRPLLYILIFLLIGMGSMTYRLYATHTPTLTEPLYDVDVSGSVSEATLNPDKQTFILTDIKFLNIPTQRTLKKIKLTYFNPKPYISVGDKITARIHIRPPSIPIEPNVYDKARVLSFQKIGAVGRVQEILSVQQTLTTWRGILEKIRRSIADRIYRVMPEETARLAIPLTIGDQSVVTPKLYTLVRGAGITHILSVSGFHLSLLAVFIFFLIRTFLALIPAISERFNTKKIAAVLALVGVMGYILISGMQVPAIRSLIMIGIVMIACLFDRNAVSVRSLSIAAFCILLFYPEMILNIGFQLSFMAVLILVTLYDPIHAFVFPEKPLSLPGRFIRFVFGFVLVDFLMTFALTPLIIYHFNQYTSYSLLGNILVGTVLAFWIMPLLFIGLVMMPFGAEGLFLKGAAIGLEYIISVCDKISHFPSAILNIASFSKSALLIMLIGTGMVCLMKTKLRFSGILVIMGGIMMACSSPRPDILIGDKGQTIAVRQGEHLEFLARAENDYTARQWLRHNGEEKMPLSERRDLPCLVSVKGQKVAFCPENCKSSDICFLPTVQTEHPPLYPLFNPKGYAVYINKGGIKVHTPESTIPVSGQH